MNQRNVHQSSLHPIPQPPHDPTWWYLDKRTGWRSSVSSQIVPSFDGHALELAHLPDGGRLTFEASGSFGGLVLPSNMAFGVNDRIYLLDRETVTLKLFDPCECLFRTVACIAGEGRESRELFNPHSVAIHNGMLYVADTGNHRVSIFTLRGWLLRAHIVPPAHAQLTQVWQPYGIAFDHCGRLLVTDPANACIHRFSAQGQWLECWSGFVGVSHIAVDCRGYIYVVSDTADQAAILLDGDGQHLATVRYAGEVAQYFRGLPFTVDIDGQVELGQLCEREQAQWFDMQGQKIAAISLDNKTNYEITGDYLSEPLDSGISQCQWHRVILHADVPASSRIKIKTYSSEIPLPSSHIQNLPIQAWQTVMTVYPQDKEDWDVLITSGRGRYLWLALTMVGDGFITPRIESMRIEFPRISLRRYLPAVFAEDPGGADFTDRFLSLVDTTLRSIEKQVDRQAALFDPAATPTAVDVKEAKEKGDFLAWLASWIGLSLNRHWPEVKRRAFVARAASLYNIRGTRYGLWQQLLFFLDLEPDDQCCNTDNGATTCDPKPLNCSSQVVTKNQWLAPPLILEHFQLRRWLHFGRGRLGEHAVLWGQAIVNRSQLSSNAQVGVTQLKTSQDPYRDPFHYYAHKFSVFVPACLAQSAQKYNALVNLLEEEKPAHTLYQLELVEPRMRIGVQASIGLNSVVGSYPQGVHFSGQALGQDTVLTAAPHKQRGPRFEIGRKSRVGGDSRV